MKTHKLNNSQQKQSALDTSQTNENKLFNDTNTFIVY